MGSADRSTFTLNQAVGSAFRCLVRTVCNRRLASSRVEPQWRLKFPTFQEVSQGFAEDSVPPFQPIELLRSFPQVSQEAGDANIGATRLVALAVCAADRQRHLAGMLRAPCDRRQQRGRLVIASR